MAEYMKKLYDSFWEMIHLSEHICCMNLKLMSLSLSVLLPLLVIIILLLVINFLLLKLVVKFIPHGEASKFHVAFFHPYCNAGGGGERVLWRAIQAIQSRYPNIECYVYTGDTDASPGEIMENVVRRFSIRLEKEPHFVYLNFRCIVEAKYHPYFTLLMQSLSSVILGTEALSKFRPDVFVDTMGYAFTYPLFRFIAGCTVASYTHYPTISSDMLERVSQRTEAHNNRAFISQNFFLSFGKLVYYHIFAFIYGLVGSCANVIMVNSSWTNAHISAIWKFGTRVQTVFPPCDTEKFSSLSLIPDNEKKIKSIVSIGQFRPEKDYPLQLRSFKKLVDTVDSETASLLSLVLIGGVRNTEDEERVESLKSLAAELEINDKVVWKVNASFSELLQEIKNGTVAIHTMWNEHFGIGIVESMAGGLIVVAHDSGGPKMDIVVPYEGNPTGFLASTEESYALAIKNILELPDEDRMLIREPARNSTVRFSEEVFRNDFLSCMHSLLDRDRSD